MTTKSRKTQHLQLAKLSQHQFNSVALKDLGLTYEPLLSAHPDAKSTLPQVFGKKELTHPLWISSMTGGTVKAKRINQILAKACHRWGLGMGLGSCRILLESKSSFKDFALRPLIKDRPFWANLGICQIHELLEQNRWTEFGDVLRALEVDGLVVHINPTQEFIQPDGSRLNKPPIEILRQLSQKVSGIPLVVKEVGQGMGPQSMQALKSLPLVGIEFGALGGTNFATLELLRKKSSVIKDKQKIPTMNALADLGHSAVEMVNFWDEIQYASPFPAAWHVVISGGRGRNVLEDVALAKVIAKSHSFSIGLGYVLLVQAQLGEKALNNWIEDYLQAFYYCWHYCHLKE